MPIECRRSRGISRRGVPIPQRSALGGRAPLQGAAYCDGGIGNLGRFACSRPWLLTDVTRPRENDVVTVAAHRPRAHKSIGMAGPSQRVSAYYFRQVTVELTYAPAMTRSSLFKSPRICAPPIIVLRLVSALPEDLCCILPL
jgi:hypothetical protein